VGSKLKTIVPLRHKRNLCSGKRCAQESNYHAFTRINLDRFSLLVSITNSCIAAVYHAIAQYTQKRDTGVHKRQIFAAKLQILASNACLTRV